MFFLRKPNHPASRLIQIHEYLALLEGGTESVSVSDRIKRNAVTLAQSLRDELRLEPWSDLGLDRVFARRDFAHHKLMLHVPLALEDCFFIAVYPQDSQHAHTHFVFDIGAEYQPPFLEAPDFGVAEVATQDNLRRWIPRLGDFPDAFAVVALREGTYMQVYADEKGFHIEHQLVSTGSHYRMAEPVSSELAVQTLVSYACGKHEWAYRAWEWMSL